MQEGIERPFDVKIVTDVVVDEGKPFMAKQIADIVHPARHQIIHTDDGMTVRNQKVAEVASEKPRSTGDQNPHWNSPFIRALSQRPVKNSALDRLEPAGSEPRECL